MLEKKSQNTQGRKHSINGGKPKKKIEGEDIGNERPGARKPLERRKDHDKKRMGTRVEWGGK